MHANKRTELQSASAGDIVAVSGMKLCSTGNTICAEHNPIVYDLMKFPETVISVAIEPKTTADEKKLMATLDQLKIEDPSFNFVNNKETGQLLILGMGELHLEIITDRLTREFKVGVNIGKPQVAYRESISNTADENKIVNRDLGGKNQFGHAHIRVESIDNQQGVFFESKINKRDLPKEILEGIEKSIKDTSLGGALAGYPFINIRATLLKADFNDEESVEVAYVIAAAQAFRDACIKAELVMMEPMMSLEVVTPQDYTGDVISDINMKNGKVLSMDTKLNKDLVHAEVPLAKMFGYSTDLRSKTQGRANFTMTFSYYKEMPRSQTKDVLAKKGIYID